VDRGGWRPLERATEVESRPHHRPKVSQHRQRLQSRDLTSPNFRPFATAGKSHRRSTRRPARRVISVRRCGDSIGWQGEDVKGEKRSGLGCIPHRTAVSGVRGHRREVFIRDRVVPILARRARRRQGAGREDVQDCSSITAAIGRVASVSASGERIERTSVRRPTWLLE